MEEVVVRGVTVARDEAKVTICDVPDRPGLAAKIFTKLSDANINVDMILQNVSRTGSTDVSFTVTLGELAKTLTTARQVARAVGAKGVIYDDKIAKVSVVGVGMRSHSGIAARMFQALAKQSINIEMIPTSEIKISCVISKAQAVKAVRALHKAFGLDRLGTKPQLALVR